MIYLGAAIGSLIGGYVPSLWGADIFSGWSILLATAVGLLGVYVAYRFTA